MLCPNCGFSYEGTPKFCPQCGTVLQTQPINPTNGQQTNTYPINTSGYTPPVPGAQAPQQSEAPQPAYVPNEYTPQQSEAPQPAYVPNEYTPQAEPIMPPPPVEKKKSLFKKPKFWIITAVIALVIAVAVILVTGGFFNTDLSYAKEVHKDAAEDFSEDFSELYTELKSGFSSSSGTNTQNIAGTLELEVEVGNKLLKIISNIVGTDLSWAKEAAIGYRFNAKDGKYLVELSLKLNKKDIVSADIILDMVDTKTMYITSKELIDTYISFPLPDIDFPQPDPDFFKQIADLLPDAKTVERMINRYVKVALDKIEKVDKKNDTVEIGSLKATYSKYTITVDDKLITNMLKAVLKEADKDGNLKDIVKAFELYLKNSLPDDISLLEEFDKGIDEMLASLNGNILGNSKFYYSFWTDGDGDIAGIELDFEGDIVSVVSIEKGQKSAFKLELTADGTDSFIYSGESVTSNGKKNGKYSLKVKGIEIITVSLIDFVSNEGAFGGAVEIAPSAMVSNLLSTAIPTGSVPQEIIDLISNGLKLRLDFSVNAKDFGFSLSVLSGSDMLAAISEKMEISLSASDVEIPNKSIDVENVKSPEQVGLADLNTITSKLIEAGIPRELIEHILALAE